MGRRGQVLALALLAALPLASRPALALQPAHGGERPSPAGTKPPLPPPAARPADADIIPAADVAPPAPVPAPAPPRVPGSPPADRELKRGLPPPRPNWRSRDRIVYAFDRPAMEVVTPSAELSAACRAGAFIQRVNLLYRAFGPREQPLGVAYGRGAINLVDPGRLRRDDTVYFFKDQDTARCTVHTALLEDIRPFFIGP